MRDLVHAVRDASRQQYAEDTGDPEVIEATIVETDR